MWDRFCIFGVHREVALTHKDCVGCPFNEQTLCAERSAKFVKIRSFATNIISVTTFFYTIDFFTDMIPREVLETVASKGDFEYNEVTESKYFKDDAPHVNRVTWLSTELKQMRTKIWGCTVEIRRLWVSEERKKEVFEKFMVKDRKEK